MAEVKEKQGLSSAIVTSVTMSPVPRAQKKNRHVVIALAHMNKRRDALIYQREKISDEIEELEAAILALQ